MTGRWGEEYDWKAGHESRESNVNNYPLKHPICRSQGSRETEGDEDTKAMEWSHLVSRNYDPLPGRITWLALILMRKVKNSYFRFRHLVLFAVSGLPASIFCNKNGLSKFSSWFLKFHAKLMDRGSIVISPFRVLQNYNDVFQTCRHCNLTAAALQSPFLDLLRVFTFPSRWLQILRPRQKRRMKIMFVDVVNNNWKIITNWMWKRVNVTFPYFLLSNYCDMQIMWSVLT